MDPNMNTTEDTEATPVVPAVGGDDTAETVAPADGAEVPEEKKEGGGGAS